MLNKDNTLTVAHLLRALKDGRITEDMPIGVIVYNETRVLGIVAHEIHTYENGEKVFTIHTEHPTRLVSDAPGKFSTEVGY